MRSIDELIPGSAERILAMAEREQEHRHAMDARQTDIIEKDLDHNHDVTKRGQRYGLWISAFVIIISAILALTGHPEIAAILAGVDLVGLAAVFVIGRLVRLGDNLDEGTAWPGDLEAGPSTDGAAGQSSAIEAPKD